MYMEIALVLTDIQIPYPLLFLLYNGWTVIHEEMLPDTIP